MTSHELRVVADIIVMAIVISVILLFVGIGVLVVIQACVVRRAFRRGFASNGVVARGSYGSNSMSRDDIEKLPSFDYGDKEQGKSSSPVDCAVCLENLKVGDKCRLLPHCKHSFHAKCIDVWLLRTPVCPICRTAADNSSCGLCFDEEIGRESGGEYRENQETESDHLIEGAAGNRAIRNTQLNIRITGENQAAEDGGGQDQAVNELRQRQAEDHGFCNEASVEGRGIRHESGDQQTT